MDKKNKELYAYTPEGTENVAFDVHNRESRYSHFFQLKVPYQITYQFCSGTGGSDYMNSVTLSSEKSYYMQESYAAHNLLFHTRPQHYHDFYELMLVLDGVVTQQIGENEYKYPAGSCCLINRGLRHTEGFDTSAQLLFIGMSVDFMRDMLEYCHISDYIIERKFRGSELVRFISADLQEPVHNCYLDFIPTYENTNIGGELHAMTQELLESMLFPRFGATLLVRAQLYRFLSYISTPEKYHCTTIELSAKNDYLLFSRIGHLMEEKHGRITRKDLEVTLNYSGDYLNRIVKKYSGMSLFDFGMSFCIKYAADCLLSTGESISDIALKCGFSNKTHFYKWFKKTYACTPQEYRRRQEKGSVLS